MQLRNGLEEWETGVFVPVDFEETKYGPIYRDIIANLNLLLRNRKAKAALEEQCETISALGGYVLSSFCYSNY